MDIWTWISELPNSDEWNPSNSVFTVSSKNNNSTQSIQLRAERIIGLNSEVFLTFSICFIGFQCFDGDEEETVIWTSDKCSLGTDKPLLPLVLQLLQEIVSRSPTAHDSSMTCPRSLQLEKLKPEPVSWILDSHSPESFSTVFNLIFLTHLFWLCAWDSPSEVGSFYFRSLLSPNVDAILISCKQASVLRNFFIAIGADLELCFMRALGYMLAKWLILKDVETGFQFLTPLPSHGLGLSYATEAHGLWVLKGYSPVKSMSCMQCKGQNSRFPAMIKATESLLKYALAHQQLEAVIQLEYTVEFYDNYIKVNARVDNLRLHVVKLGFGKDSEDMLLDEKYFPSRVRVCVGPEVGASYVGGLSLSRSTDNMEREMEMEKVLKGSYGKSMANYEVKATEKMATRTRFKNWRWDQDVEGNAAIFDAVLCDNSTGAEIATWKPPIGVETRTMINFRNRYKGGGRAFTKSGGLVFSGAECGGEGVTWRLSKEVEGSVLKWRIRGKVWLTYLPSEVTTSFHETRCIEWCDEVDLPLILAP